ncbi:MAG: 2-oxo acid dehydrogenase subunit E2 [Xanthomonadaceae bacterium]|nr:2-oxo acid dehydrogenase subunit E2 [Xanthomonadaceae bacterium]
MADYKLPELGEGVHEGELVKWRVAVGDVVKDDQPICEVMTDKATMEIPAPFTGMVLSLEAKEGSVVKVGQTLIKYEGAAGSKAAANPPSPAAHAPSSQHAKAPAPASSGAVSAAQVAIPATAVSLGSKVTAAPSARRFAREMGADLGMISGSGPNNRVMREDIENFIKGGNKSSRPATQTRSVHSGGEERIAFKGLRKKISEKMRLSKDKAAHFTYVEECDATELVKLRNAAKELGAKQGIKVTYLPIVMKAMVAALKRFPIMNATLDEATNEIVMKHYYNIGLSVQTDDGLTAPVVKNVESKSLLQLAKEIQDLVDKSRAKRLTMEDLTGGTITLTNAGSIGGLFATPIINFPEVAILGFNKIFRKPVVKVIGGREKMVIRDWTLFSISLDHRIVDGAVAAEFMKVFIPYIENPSLLVLEE